MAPVLRERLDLAGECDNAGIVREHLARYDFASLYVSGKSVLDVGCGTGYGASMMRKAGAKEVVGVGISGEAIQRAMSRYGGEGIRFVVADAEEFALKGLFDVITSFETIEHPPNPDEFLRGVAKLLLSDGQFIVSTPVRQNGTIETKPENPLHIREWSVAEFRELLSRSFKDITLYGQYELVKFPFLYSRTLQRNILRFFRPKLAAGLDQYPVVLKPPPAPLPFFFTAAYVVAVCGVPLF